MVKWVGCPILDIIAAVELFGNRRDGRNPRLVLRQADGRAMELYFLPPQNPGELSFEQARLRQFYDQFGQNFGSEGSRHRQRRDEHQASKTGMTSRAGENRKKDKASLAG